MQVYIVMENNTEYADNNTIDRVFASEDKAFDYVIQKHYSSSFYKNMRRDVLENNASGYIIPTWVID